VHGGRTQTPATTLSSHLHDGYVNVNAGQTVPGVIGSWAETLSSTPRRADEPFVANTSIMTSRAVVRPIEPGNSAVCVHCGAPVKFVARAQLKQVIANVYENGAWNRVEHFHADCYGEAGLPYGEADTSGLRN
jgi:hypothetical protein